MIEIESLEDQLTKLTQTAMVAEYQTRFEDLFLPPNPAFPQPRKLSAVEAQARRAKGLCYYCDAKFVPGHHCKEPQFFLLDDASNDIQPNRAGKNSDSDERDLED
ncbi:hypothetical protein J1N35_034096 [Gossypium stocksii]|uniref:Retrotransposon gag domain-containing protein n=1 Tax=Gossypium stocksii TaxID=47602 RepID=A0A9D3ZNZ4_9ROSI|nr:hypothetical protein J1N35_034096 [Gossypium stocksii]